MKISVVIEKLKNYFRGGDGIHPETMPDGVLYGTTDRECTGIVTAQWPSVEVIKKAKELGANLIITHERLFWNHGEHTDWLAEDKNKTYLGKRKLLESSDITIWRCHDYVHSGIPLQDGSYCDGIFYGLVKELGWEQYLVKNSEMVVELNLPETTVEEVAKYVIKKLKLRGSRVLGNPHNKVTKVAIPFHVMGEARKEISFANDHNVSLYLTAELIDYTLSEYVRDSSQLNFDKSILALGHFNLEEPGMNYMATYIPKAIGEAVPCQFVKSGDMYHYVTA